MIVLPSIDDPRLVDMLKRGAVGVIPTDTIYGLAAIAANRLSVERLYDLKHRYQKLGTFIAADMQQLLALGLEEQALLAVAHLWPNPISVVVPTLPGWAHLDLGKGSLAVRIPKQPALINLLKKTGPLATTSANLFDQPPSTTIKEAKNYFGEAVDFYVEGGDLAGRPPSTLARFESGRLEVLRPGAVTINPKGEIVL